MGKMITLMEYAKRIGKNARVVRRKAANGDFKTAAKIGRDWFIDEDEEYIDRRFTSGKYCGWREKYGKKHS